MVKKILIYLEPVPKLACTEIDYYRNGLMITELGHMNVPDEIWNKLKHLLPQRKTPKSNGGRPRLDDRIALSAIFYRCKTGIAWREMPPQFGTKSTLHRRFQEWVSEGVFDKIQNEALKLYERRIKIRNKRMAMDGSVSRSPKGGFSPVEIRQTVVKKALKSIS